MRVKQNMDSSASVSPGPESRRRSGRVVRAPDKFAPDGAHAAAKRKRGDGQGGDNAENEGSDSDELSDPPADDDDDDDDEPSDAQDSEDDAARRRAAVAKKKKPSRPRKPATKRAKTNGASAGAGKHPASLPSRPKKSVRIERLPEEGTGLFGQSLQLRTFIRFGQCTDVPSADIFGSGDSSDSVAEQWLTRYRADDCAAMAELVNCVLQCSGCDIEVTEDDIRDPDNCQNRLTDIQGVWQDVSTPYGLYWTRS